MSVAGLKFGKDLAEFLISNHRDPEKKIQVLHKMVPKKFKFDELPTTDWISICLGFSWVVVIVLTALVNVRRDLLFATVFAPFGISISII